MNNITKNLSESEKTFLVSHLLHNFLLHLLLVSLFALFDVSSMKRNELKLKKDTSIDAIAKQFVFQFSGLF